MKWLGLVFLPLALSTPVQERALFFDAHTLTTLFNTTILKQDLQNLVDIIGSDASEQLCERSCVPMMQKADHTHLLQHTCPLVCSSLQMLIQKLHLTHPAQNPVQTLKRTLFSGMTSGLKTEQITALLQQLVDMLGSDPTTQMIENECHVIMKHPILDSGCHFIARGFQSLLQSLHIHPKPNTPGAVINTRRTRSIIDTIVHTLGLNMTQLRIDAQQMLDVLGADATEQMMEAYCHQRIKNALIDHACPLVAHGMQYLIQHLHLIPDPGTPGSGNPVG